MELFASRKEIDIVMDPKKPKIYNAPQIMLANSDMHKDPMQCVWLLLLWCTMLFVYGYYYYIVSLTIVLGMLFYDMLF